MSLPANAATGEDGSAILYAGYGDLAHKRGVAGSADGYQGVACADIITSAVTPADFSPHAF
jgi:hypothetical protein